MPLHKLVLPAMGEGITDATIIRWLVDEGDAVTKDQPLVEIATDKVDSEIPSPHEGIIKKIVAVVGEIPKVGDTIAFIQSGSDDPFEVKSKQEMPTFAAPEKIKEFKLSSRNQSHKKQHEKAPIALSTDNSIFIPPFVRTLAQRFNINWDEFNAYIMGLSCSEVTAEDLFEYLNLTRKAESFSSQYKETEKKQQPDNTAKTEDEEQPVQYQDAAVEKVPLSRIRRKIADNMLYASRNIPHVSSFIEVDATPMVAWRETVKDAFFAKYNAKLTYTPLFVEAIVASIRKLPLINVSTDGDNLLIKKDIHVGMATVLPDGNLIVPVIKDADKDNLQGLAQKVNDLANRARNLQLKPAEASGSTFTFTNIGVFGSLTGTPLINIPESAILGIGSISKKPYVVYTQGEPTIGIRDIVMLSLSYDHRIIDGALAGRFLDELKKFIENFDSSRAL